MKQTAVVRTGLNFGIFKLRPNKAFRRYEKAIHYQTSARKQIKLRRKFSRKTVRKPLKLKKKYMKILSNKRVSKSLLTRRYVRFVRSYFKFINRHFVDLLLNHHQYPGFTYIYGYPTFDNKNRYKYYNNQIQTQRFYDLKQKYSTFKSLRSIRANFEKTRNNNYFGLFKNLKFILITKIFKYGKFDINLSLKKKRPFKSVIGNNFFFNRIKSLPGTVAVLRIQPIFLL